jgi:hypothetical protein
MTPESALLKTDLDADHDFPDSARRSGCGKVARIGQPSDRYRGRKPIIE